MNPSVPSVPSEPSIMTSASSCYNYLSVFFNHHHQPIVASDHQFHGFSPRRPASSASQSRPPQPLTLRVELQSRSGRSSATPSQHSSRAQDQPPPSNGTSDSDSDVSDSEDMDALLTCAVRDLAKSAGCSSSTSTSSQRTKVRVPDQFNGLEPRKLRTFLI